MSGFEVGVGALSAPAQRLKQISADLGTARSGAGTAAASASGAAGDPRVAAAADAVGAGGPGEGGGAGARGGAAGADPCGAGVTALLGALADDARLLADKVQQAGVTY